MNAHADMFNVAERNELNTPRGIYRSLVSGERNFAGFLLTKTSANKRLLLCLQNRGAVVQYCSTSFRIVQYCPFAPSLRCKGSEKFTIVQIFQLKV